ncbi:MAG: L-seryl-tRNA(Sec) selenium transferase [Bacillota bacterium]|uniref:L-seryl-tRNA(Sec) selenium transferase n=1 Tax=Thermanaerosceptrum fracticalcis TaxID=1712410 RepID=A0A7G6E5D0_THEFR|nr:L-seryl-tRNA(Sec) selenium transferase [Thermanaerosceptrum fracticalcis]QNB47284.1 L-seryl-tRNA(Sec) selenium transferase [Thermanaerosceptrum fracticalcis]
MSNSRLNELLRQLPAVNTVLVSEKGRELSAFYGHDLVAEATGQVLGVWRQRIIAQAGEVEPPSLAFLLKEIESYLISFAMPRLRRVINATGIILHTNLGRAVLSKNAQTAVALAASCYSNLEYDLGKGERGTRYAHVEELLIRLTGAESALVVNNNAAAVLLAMNTLATGKEVVVSRGELVEIGGSFRIPEVLKQGGATLVEVGTTNRTHLYDYQKALNENTGLILKVHTSNYRIIGFTRSVSRHELQKLARANGIPLMEDLGSGSLLDLSAWGFTGEPPVPQVVAEGVDIVTFSGDKLLGGPQAGIIVGKKEYIDAMKANQLTRALRVDKFTLAALEATLREYLRPEEAVRNIPTYRMLAAPLEELREKVEKIMRSLTFIQDKIEVQALTTQSQMGGGSLPGQTIPSWGIGIKFKTITLEEAEKALRQLPVPVIGYIERDTYILDMRTLLPGDDEVVIRSIYEIVS